MDFGLYVKRFYIDVSIFYLNMCAQDMNEPANFDTNINDPNGDYRLICPETRWDDPPYVPSKNKYKKKLFLIYIYLL